MLGIPLGSTNGAIFVYSQTKTASYSMTSVRLIYIVISLELHFIVVENSRRKLKKEKQSKQKRFCWIKIVGNSLQRQHINSLDIPPPFIESAVLGTKFRTSS